MTAPAAYKPGKEGTVTDILMNKNIGIDGKTLMLIDDRVARVREDNPQIGDIVEYKQLAQGPDKGKISFFAIKHRASDKGAAPAVPAEEPEQKAPAREPTTITGKYVDKTSKTITIHDGKDNRVIRADLDLIMYLSKAGTNIVPGMSVTLRLIDNNGLWVAKDIGPGPEGFKTGKEVSEPTEAEMAAACKINPKNCEFASCAVPGNATLCLKEWKHDSKEKVICPHIPIVPVKTGKEILQENLDTAKQAAPPVQEKPLVQQIVPEKEAEQLKARGEAAKMEKIRKEAEAHQEKMKAENAARKAAEERPSETMTSNQTSYADTDVDSDGSELAECPVELSVHLDCGSYSNFDLKAPALPIDQAIARIEADGMKSIAMMRRLMTAAKKGY